MIERTSLFSEYTDLNASLNNEGMDGLGTFNLRQTPSQKLSSVISPLEKSE